MKKVVFVVVACVCSAIVFAQIQNPVHWSYSARKLDANTYEVHLTAKIDAGWHLYSQTTPEGGPVPTSIIFSKNPLFTLQGSAREIGKLQQKQEPLFGVDVKQYSTQVDFVQTIKLKAQVKTNAVGSIKFMVCDDTQCLPPATHQFSVALK